MTGAIRSQTTMKFRRDECRNLFNVVALAFLLASGRAKAEIDASIEYQVEGDGFHRSVRYHVDMGDFYRDNCYVALRLNLESALYANVDELADLRRLGKTTACSEGEIDVELFAEKANGQRVTICSELKEFDNVLKVPIHQRYQLPRRHADFVNATLPKPALLLGCKERIGEYPLSEMGLCSPCAELSLEWREIPYKTKTERYVWTVAVGNISYLQHVTQITLFTVFFGTIVILRALWYARDDKGDKRN